MNKPVSSDRPLVAIAMSGGVDSSVAAALLIEKGYRVFGVTMKLWCYAETQAKAKSCCSLAAIEDAKSVAATLQIPHYVINMEECFDKDVIRPFCLEYLRGATPNPCVLCNTRVKFSTLMDKALSMGADFIATGHYAIIDRAEDELQARGEGAGPETSGGGTKSRGRAGGPDARNQRGRAPEPGSSWRLRRGVDRGKDQSYVLWGIEKTRLPRILFPLGTMTKREVRDVASRLGLRSAERIESQDICFVESGSCGEFVTQRLSRMGIPISPGPVTDVHGARLGTHNGLVNFTVGQRRGLGISASERLYVIALRPESNTLVVGEKRDLLAREFVCSDVNWLADIDGRFPLKALVQIRYTHTPASADIDVETEEDTKSGFPHVCRQVESLRGGPNHEEPIHDAMADDRGVGDGSSVDRGAGHGSPVDGGTGHFAAAHGSERTQYGSGHGAPARKIGVKFEKAQSAITPGQSAVFYRGDEVLGGGIIEKWCAQEDLNPQPSDP